MDGNHLWGDPPEMVPPYCKSQKSPLSVLVPLSRSLQGSQSFTVVGCLLFPLLLVMAPALTLLSYFASGMHIYIPQPESTFYAQLLDLPLPGV